MAVRKLKVSMQQFYLSGKLKTDDALDWLFYKILDCLSHKKLRRT